MILSDADLFALNLVMEADGEPDDGIAAVAQVVKNRMRMFYTSDGTIIGTVLAFDQFSWAWFAFKQVLTGTAMHKVAREEYVRVAWTLEQAETIASRTFTRCNLSSLARCRVIGNAVEAGSYRGAEFDKLTPDTVLYLNPDPRLIVKLPGWAVPEKLVATIGRHNFYRP